VGHVAIAAGRGVLRLGSMKSNPAMWQRPPRRTCKDAGMQSLRQEVALLDCLPLDRLMPVAGLQDVGHAAVATGSGALKLRSF